MVLNLPWPFWESDIIEFNQSINGNNNRRDKRSHQFPGHKLFWGIPPLIISLYKGKKINSMATTQNTQTKTILQNCLYLYWIYRKQTRVLLIKCQQLAPPRSYWVVRFHYNYGLHKVDSRSIKLWTFTLRVPTTRLNLILIQAHPQTKLVSTSIGDSKIFMWITKACLLTMRVRINISAMLLNKLNQCKGRALSRRVGSETNRDADAGAW